VQRLEAESGAVQVMTMHKSKGLEAPVVFLAGGFTGPGGKGAALSIFHDGDGQRAAWVGPADGEVAEACAREEREEAQRLLYVALTRAGARLYLPYFGPLDADGQRQCEALGLAAPGAEYRPGGAGALLNARLKALREAGRAGVPEGFALEVLACRAAPQARLAAAGALAGWMPPDALLEPERDDALEMAALRREHAGFFVTSYSRLAAAERAAAEDEGPEEGPATAPDAWAPVAEDELPPGVETGRFLHEVLEAVDLPAARGAASLGAWREGGALDALVARVARLHGIEERHLDRAAAVVWAALRSPLRLPGTGRVLAGVAQAERVVREMEFLFPIPEAAHPLLGRARLPAGTRYTVERGCVRGFVDVLFEHEGRVYFADWKSDLLPDYGPEALAARVTADYALQEQLYTLGVVRLLGVRDEADYEARFGGSLYCFLRGMDPREPGAGVIGTRVSFRQVVAWEEALLGRRDWGLGAATAAPAAGPSRVVSARASRAEG
jgi:exodeoxyribonuclease V beta subunit